MACLGRPGCRNRKRCVSRAVEVHSIELPLVTEQLACSSGDLKRCRGAGCDGLGLRVLCDERFVWSAAQRYKWCADSSNGHDIGNPSWYRDRRNGRLNECPIFLQGQQSRSIKRGHGPNLGQARYWARRYA